MDSSVFVSGLCITPEVRLTPVLHPARLNNIWTSVPALRPSAQDILVVLEQPHRANSVEFPASSAYNY